MKKFFQIIFLVFFLGVWAVVLINKESVRNFVQEELGINQSCSKPLRYSIGDIDPKFNISPDELKNEALKAEDVWEKAAGKNLFQYDASAPFKINLIYDERQEMISEQDNLNRKLEELKSRRDLISSQYDKLNASLKSRIDTYRKSVTDYEKSINDFNDEVDYWNKKGGAPGDVYNKLKKEEKDIKSQLTELEDEKKAINNLIAKSNNLAASENAIVSSYNASVNTYQNKYGGAREFEKGIFDGEAINIYEFQERNDLEMTLIHELGHYLGLDHTRDPQSIMYPMIGEQNMDSPALAEEDLNELKNVCKLK